MQTYKLIFGRWWLFIFCIIPLFKISYANNLLSQDYYITYNEYNKDSKEQQESKIHLREKNLYKVNHKPRKVIILVNPLSIPSLEAFDIPSYSLMDTFAYKGYDVWGVDFTGQGGSSYPKSMQISPAPIGVFPLPATDAVPQLSKVIDYVLKKTGNSSVTILGWSWGSVVASMYAIENPKKVNHLILYGAMYSSRLPNNVEDVFIKPYASQDHQFSKILPAYQNIPWQIIQKHWQMMIKGNTTIANKSAFDAVGTAYRKIDKNPFIIDTLRRPMGPMKDLFAIWNGVPLYDIKKLTVPTLVIYGDQDLFADHNLYNQLTGVKIKEEAKLYQATHWLIYEKTRYRFNEVVLKFLNK